MHKDLKLPPKPPVDVRALEKLTLEEQKAQRCDPRSWVAEISADPQHPIRVTDTSPNLGGRRLFLFFHNALFEQVPRVRQSQLQKPNMKALHLHSAAYHWQRAQDLYKLLTDLDSGLEMDKIEEVGMDFMEAVIVSVYGAISTIEVFTEEVIFERLNAEEMSVGGSKNLVETMKDVLPGLTHKSKPTQTNWWQQFRNIHRARNSFTHVGIKNIEKQEEVVKGFEGLLIPGLDLPDVVRRIIRHFSDVEPPWVSLVIKRGQEQAGIKATWPCC